MIEIKSALELNAGVNSEFNYLCGPGLNSQNNPVKTKPAGPPNSTPKETKPPGTTPFTKPKPGQPQRAPCPDPNRTYPVCTQTH